MFFYTPNLTQDPNAASASFETIQTTAQANWVSQQRLSRAPAMQFVGPGNRSIVIAGRIYPKSLGGLGTLSQLETLMNSGNPLDFIRYTTNGQQATGTVAQGKYVIVGINKAEQKVDANNIPFRVDFSLELQRYGDDISDGAGGFKIFIQ